MRSFTILGQHKNLWGNPDKRPSWYPADIPFVSPTSTKEKGRVYGYNSFSYRLSIE